MACFSPLKGSQIQDFQIWNYTSLFGPLNKCVNFYGETTFRWDHNASRFFQFYEHIEFPINLCLDLIIGPAYRQIYVKNDQGDWIPEYQSQLNLTFVKNICNWVISDRSRFAYRCFDNHFLDTWQYRNKLALLSPPINRCLDLKLFIDDEVFFEQHGTGVVQNRFSTGLTFILLGNLRGEVGYRRQTIKGITWRNNNILMLDLRANF